MTEPSIRDLATRSGPLTGLAFQRALDALGDPVVAADATNRVLYLNRAAEDLLGWPGRDLIGMPLTVIMPERFRDAHIAGFQRFLATRVPRIMGSPIRVPALRRDGEEIDIELTLSAVAYEDGEPLIVASLRDLRERVELERQIAISHYLRATTDAAARMTSHRDLLGVTQIIVDTLVQDFLAALARVWLYDPRENVLRLRASAGLSTGTTTSSRSTIDVATYPYKVARVARSREPLIQNGLSGDPEFDAEWVEREGIEAAAVFPLVIADELLGVVALFSRTPFPDEMVEALTTLMVVAGSTLSHIAALEAEQRTRAEAEAAQQRFAFLSEASALLASSLDYETTLRHLAALIVPQLADWCSIHIVQPDGTVRSLVTAHEDPTRVEMAAQLERRYPYDPDAPSGVPNVLRTGASEFVAEITEELLDVAVQDTELREILRALGLRSSMIVPLVARDRTLGAITLVSAESGRIYGAGDLALAEDLARRAGMAVDNARLYSELQDAIRVRDDFISSVSHDLKNPLAAMRGQAQLLRRRVLRDGGADVESLVRGLDQLVTTASRMNALIQDLVDVAHLKIGRPLALNLDQTDLIELVHQVVREQQSATGNHTFRVETNLERLEGEWDALRLERVLGNLLSNAVKYSPNGGIVRIGVDVEPGSDGETAVLTVEDRGIGIPVADVPHVFERYRRGSNAVGRFAGSGIGLAGVKQIVEQHGGTVHVESTEGAGATFTVRLPLAPEQV